MPVLPRRFKRLKSILNRRISNLTVVLEAVEKPHNLSAILRSCDAVGVLEAHAISNVNRALPTFNSTAQGSQKWVKLNHYQNVDCAVKSLKDRGFKLYGTVLDENSIDYRKCDFTGATAFVLGAEKWGLSDEAKKLIDSSIYIPMRGMVQSLNVSVAAAILLFEALRQREDIGILPLNGEGLEEDLYKQIIFEWTYPEVAEWCKKEGAEYPTLNEKGEIIDQMPRSIKIRF